MSKQLNWFDRLFNHGSRHLARHTSRRSILNKIGLVIVGVAATPLLPMARADNFAKNGLINKKTRPGEPKATTPQGDETNCSYWRYCSLDGFMASCCGGTTSSCPPGTEMSPVAWIGSCRNPADGKNYIVSYNDCCGKTNCQRCFCNRNEGEKPVYYPSKSNDIDWCMGKAGIVYNSTVSVVIGVEQP
jgi:methylamine dehydrogenase light chain